MLVKVVSNQALAVASSRPLCLATTRSITSQASQSNLPTEAPTERSDKLAVFRGKRFPDFESTYRRRGPGGRASFNGLTATVFNGYGFVANNLVARLGKSGTQLVLAYRDSRYNTEKNRISGDLGQVYYSHFHLKDEKTLYDAMQYSNVVVNLIGKESETRNFSYDEVHVEGARRLARIAREVGVKKFIHISSLNVSPNPEPKCLKTGSRWLKSKYYGELAVREEFPEAVIFRPADMMGQRDNFLGHFTAMMRSRYTHKCALWDYYDGVEKQPLYISDLISGIERAISDDSANGKTFQAVGPHRYDFYELIEYMRACGGQGQKYDDCRITNLRYDIGMKAMIWVMEKTMKYPFLTWERIERDCHSDYIDPKLPTLTDLGVELTPLEPHIERLAHYRPREQRVEIPFESALTLDEPRRLDLVR